LNRVKIIVILERHIVYIILNVQIYKTEEKKKLLF